MTDNSFLRMFSPTRVSRTCKAAAVLLAGLPVSASFATDYTWLNTTGNFTDATKWTGGLVPTGTNATDVLIFGSAVSGYTATNNSGSNPFLVNQLVFSTGAGGIRTIQGTTIKLGGLNPTISQNGSAEISIKAPIELGADLTLNGTGTGAFPTETNKVTLDGALSGNFNIVKNGTFTFRFGTTASGIYSGNTWFGGLTINAGIVRFNNNAYAAPTALRSNPVTMTSASALLTTSFRPLGTGANQDPDASLRLGTLNGSAGTVRAKRELIVNSTTQFNSADIVITALDPGSFGGTIDNDFTAGGTDNGKLIIRGVATQTFTGLLTLAKDVSVGGGAGMTLAGNTTHQGNAANSSSAVIISGGTFTLDNTTTNVQDRLKNGTGTGLEPIGGGKFSLIGNAAGTTEDLGRLQLAANNGTARSGALTINVTSNGSAGSALRFSEYRRVLTNPVVGLRPTNTVNFTANDGQAVLGGSLAGSRVLFTSAVPLTNQLLGSATGSTENVGWATVNGQDFATYDATLGVKAVSTDPAPAGNGAGSSSTNGLLTTGLTLTNAGGYSINSLKIAPEAPGLSIDIATAGTFRTYGVLLAGPVDFAINASSTGPIAGPDATSPRYFHVQQATLTVGANLNGTSAPVVKAGQGVLNLTNNGNILMTGPLVINEGAVRSAVGNSLPGGEIRFRGGVLEISGGGTLTRTLGGGSGSINWSGVDGANAAIGEEQGSGGFAAVGADAQVNLTGATLTFSWEDTGFVNSGHALIFGSPRADAKITWTDDLKLTANAPQVTNYNAREIRVVDNPSSTTDLAVITGRISGSVQDDLLKTGAGTLILTSATNSYLGATLVHEGALLVNDTGTIQSSFLTNVRNTATLGGNGRIGRVKVESGGTIAPGNALGNTSKLTTGDVLLADVGAKLAIELGGTTIGGDGISGYDQLVAIGEVILNGGTLVGTKLSGFAANPGSLFFIVDNDGTDPVQGTFAQGNQITIGGELFNISYTGDLGTNAFTGGNDIVLEYVPEPTSAALLAFGAAALGLARRRRPATA